MVQTKNVKFTSRTDTGPVEDIKGPADLAGEIHIVSEREFQRPAERDRDAWREGDLRIPGIRLEHHPQCVHRAHRKTYVDRDGNWCGNAIVIPHDKKWTRSKIDEADVAVRQNQARTVYG